MLEKIEPPEEKRKLEDDMKALASTWQKVHEDLEERKKVLEEVHDKAKKMEDAKDSLDNWLSETEEKLRDLKPVSCIPSEIESQKGELNVSIFCQVLSPINICLSALL